MSGQHLPLECDVCGGIEWDDPAAGQVQRLALGGFGDERRHLVGV
jgi:hypothetical protein